MQNLTESMAISCVFRLKISQTALFFNHACMTSIVLLVDVFDREKHQERHVEVRCKCTHVYHPFVTMYLLFST